MVALPAGVQGPPVRCRRGGCRSERQNTKITKGTKGTKKKGNTKQENRPKRNNNDK